MKVEVVKYRSEWSREFEAEAERIKEILGDEAIEIYHIGSTSVEGLSAKPIIDIMPVVKDISRIDKLNPAFEALATNVWANSEFRVGDISERAERNERIRFMFSAAKANTIFPDISPYGIIFVAMRTKRKNTDV